jgi:cytoskeletal protein CcmA (bactofilin family)
MTAMMFKGDASQGDLNGFVDRGSQLEGELRFENSFRVDGRVAGTVVSEGSLAIGENGEVDGDVRVGQVLVAGTLKGSVQAQHKVQITAGGKVFADLATPSLVIEDGAIFEGRCTMTRQDRPAEGRAAPVPKLVAKASGSREP